MIPVVAYLLRQKTRPTNEEGQALWGRYMLLHHREAFLQALAKEADATDVRMNISNVTGSQTVDEVFDQFIRTNDGGRYLDHPAAFEVVIHNFESGDPPEPTKLAIVFARTVEEIQGTATVPSEVEPFLARGSRWEDLGRWGDAALCYAVALRVCGVHPEIYFRLGKALMHFPRELSGSVHALEQAGEALPARADIQAALGRCFVEIADHEEVPIVGLERNDVRRMGIARLEGAARLDPEDTGVADELAVQHRLVGHDSEESFYD